MMKIGDYCKFKPLFQYESMIVKIFSYEYKNNTSSYYLVTNIYTHEKYAAYDFQLSELCNEETTIYLLER